MNSKIIDKLKSLIKTPLHRNALFLIADSALASLLGFAFWALAARFYVETDIGLASTLISSIGLLATASTLGFTVGLIRFLPQTNEKEFSKILNSCFTVSGTFALILALIFILGLDVWSPALSFLRNNILVVIIFIFFAFALTIANLLNGVFISSRKAEFVFIKNSIVTSILKLILLISLSIVAIGMAYNNIFYSWGIAASIAVLISFLLFLPKIRRSYKPNVSIEIHSINHMMRFSAGNYVAIFFLSAPLLILPLMITNVLSADITAYFYLAWMMANLLFFIPSAVGVSLLSEMSHEEVHYDEKTKKAAKFIALLLTPGIILFLLLGDQLLLLFGASYSANASTALSIFTISSIPLAVNAIYVTVKNAMKQVRYVILVNGAIAIGTLGSSYLLMVEYGLYGIAVAWLVSQTVVASAVLISTFYKKIKSNL